MTMQLALIQQHLLHKHLSKVLIAIRLHGSGQLTTVNTLLSAGKSEMGMERMSIRSEA
jgi:hypothetical protein